MKKILLLMVISIAYCANIRSSGIAEDKENQRKPVTRRMPHYRPPLFYTRPRCFGHARTTAIIDLPKNICSLSKLGNIEEITKLIEQDKNIVNHVCESGFRPIHFAAYRNYPELLDLLLQNGAQVNVTDNDGNSPLHLAAEAGNSEIVKTLLRHNANHIMNIHGKTPYDVATNDEIISLLIEKKLELD